MLAKLSMPTSISACSACTSKSPPMTPRAMSKSLSRTATGSNFGLLGAAGAATEAMAAVEVSGAAGCLPGAGRPGRPPRAAAPPAPRRPPEAFSTRTRSTTAAASRAPFSAAVSPHCSARASDRWAFCAACSYSPFGRSRYATRVEAKASPLPSPTSRKSACALRAKRSASSGGGRWLIISACAYQCEATACKCLSRLCAAMAWAAPAASRMLASEGLLAGAKADLSSPSYSFA
mmetsp:Transcript_18603/g.48263  ORF Transcript_18603/g.48263 Transcript_18603/m.48263 type:complete len:234 (-) Transcript_18603:413-1114(-)